MMNNTLFDDYAIPDEYDHPGDFEAEKPEETALISITSLPEIVENLHALRERWSGYAKDAAAMICTEETVQSLKKSRAEMRKEFDEADLPCQARLPGYRRREPRKNSKGRVYRVYA